MPWPLLPIFLLVRCSIFAFLLVVQESYNNVANHNSVRHECCKSTSICCVACEVMSIMGKEAERSLEHALEDVIACEEVADDGEDEHRCCEREEFDYDIAASHQRW